MFSEQTIYIQIEKDLFKEVKELSVAIKNNILVPPAHAALVEVMAGKSVSQMVTAAGDKISAFKKFYMNPVTRLVFAGILTANSMMMIGNINKEVKKAEERKTFMEKLRNQVLASGTAFGCSTADRNSNLSKPQCYCYQEGGTLNPSRSKSPIRYCHQIAMYRARQDRAGYQGSD